jgi:hypothetical protein
LIFNEAKIARIRHSDFFDSLGGTSHSPKKIAPSPQIYG